ncbi:MAG: undecaprenyl-phosphate glucose phosphotransferase [Candidatus Competibacteraceae bacterium]
MLKRGIIQKYADIWSTLVRVLDPLLVVLAAWPAYFLAQDSWLLPDSYLLIAALTALLVVIIFPNFHIYESWRGESIRTELRALLLAWGAVLVTLLIMGVATKISVQFSRLWMGFWALCSSVLLVLSRLALRYSLRWLRLKGFNQRHLVIVGTSALANSVAERLLKSPWTGLNLLGFFGEEPLGDNQITVKRPLLGRIDHLAEYVRRHSVDQVWLAIPLSRQEFIDRVLHNLRHNTTDVRMVLDIFSYRLLNASLGEVAGMPLVNLSASPMHDINRLIKAIEDRIIALFILMLISPLMLVIAIGIKLSSPGPVFYRQERIGFNNKPFMMLKFRSMSVDAEVVSGPVWAKHGDRRTTKFGIFLRKTSLDELPQFINVLKGEMSIVGPRPERPFFVEHFKDQIQGYMQKHMVKAGITGWAQVNGWRGNTDLQKRIEYDLYYVENWSLWFDFKIIFLTIFKGFVNKNAY